MAGMGTWIQAEAELPRRRWLGRLLGRDRLAALASAVVESIGDAALSGLASITPGREEVAIELCPVEEPILLRRRGDEVSVRARTNSAGPGYHAFVVDLLARAGARAGVRWRAPDGSMKFADDGDPVALQRAAMTWLRAVASSVSRSTSRCRAVSLPSGFAIADDPRIATPMGPRHEQWFAELAGLEGDDLLARGAESFPWWAPALDAHAWARLGVATAWVDVPWRRPTSSRENAACTFAKAALLRALELDPSAPVPRAELDAIVDLLAREPDQRETPPSPEGLGYRRRDMLRPLPGPWHLAVPGYAHEALEHEGQTRVYWFDGWTLRGSSFSSARPVPAEELLADDGPPPDHALSYESGGLVARAYVERASEDSAQGPRSYWVLCGAVAVPGELCRVTICFDGDAQRPTVERMWRSVRFVGAPSQR